MAGFRHAEWRSNRVAMRFFVAVGLLAVVGFWLWNQVPMFGWTPEIWTSSDCKHSELAFPNGRNILANVRETACAPSFDPDHIDYFVFVHRVGEHDEKANLVFHYRPDNYGPFPVIAPRVFWSGGSSVHIALSSSPFAPSSEVSTRLTRLGKVQIMYEKADHQPKEMTAPGPTASRDAHMPSMPLWSRLHSGMKVYFGDDPVGHRNLTLCPGVDSYNHVRIKNYGPSNVDATIGTSQCIHAKYGTRATVTEIIPSRIHDWYYPAPLVRVHSDDGWTGITSALGLQPDIPIGSILTMTKKEFPVTLDVCVDGICADNPGAPRGLEIPGKVQVRVLRYDPGTHAFDNLYVEVLDGAYAGHRGWMPAFYMRSADSLYSNGYGLDYLP